ncbi:hypothetical protein HZ326_14767 [Fusarium oxysporum f. sp. albedinis]|jgi:hypothetical protein|nr:hypothetical protein HZ326_14767 [Fusarium oxysporum f. sp. albedinis]
MILAMCSIPTLSTNIRTITDQRELVPCFTVTVAGVKTSAPDVGSVYGPLEISGVNLCHEGTPRELEAFLVDSAGWNKYGEDTVRC